MFQLLLFLKPLFHMEHAGLNNFGLKIESWVGPGFGHSTFPINLNSMKIDFKRILPRRRNEDFLEHKYGMVYSI